MVKEFLEETEKCFEREKVTVLTLTCIDCHALVIRTEWTDALAFLFDVDFELILLRREVEIRRLGERSIEFRSIDPV